MILVTGGAGFIGSHVTALLTRQGSAVRILDLPTVETAHLPTSGVEIVAGDIRDRRTVARSASGCMAVLHLAANPNLWCRRRAEFDEVNHQGTRCVIEESLAVGVQRIVHVSTESILARPGNPNSLPAIETADLDESAILGPYCRSKYRAEQFALELGRKGAPVIVVNPTLPVGPGDYRMSPPTRLTVQFCRGQLPALLDLTFNLIDVRDVAQGILAAFALGQPGRRYILGHENLRLAAWLSLVGQQIGRVPPHWRMPYGVALLYAWFAERWADWISGTMPIATVTGVRLTRRSLAFDTGPTMRELGIKPRPLEESARDAVAWYRAQGWIP